MQRRQALCSLMGGSLLMPAILRDLMAAENPLAPRAPHFPPKAKRVIFLYMSGGFSHVETFDPKPKLLADRGKTHDSRKGIQYFKPSQWEFKRYGKSGIEVSDLLPKIGAQADDLCVIRSMTTDHTNHSEAALGIHTGSVSVTRPSIGSWVSYGLGSENQNLPSFVVLAPYLPYAGSQVWASDFLPGVHQGTRVTPGPNPIANLKPRVSPEVQKTELSLLGQLNARYGKGRATDPKLAARVQSFEVAWGMQQEAPDAFDLSKETDATLALYGLERGKTQGFAWQCLVARRLCERGVRFIELIDSGASTSNNWDSHGDMKDHEPRARNVDQATAALLVDLKSRGLLEDTLVVFTTEFGRTPYNDKPGAKGREHHPEVFSSWLAGAGVKGGMTYGSSDDHGIFVADKRVHVHDFHATILHLLGMNHEKLTYRHAGRDFRLTDVAGEVVKEILA